MFNSFKIIFFSHASRRHEYKYAAYVSAAEKIRSISKSEYFCHLRKNLFYFYLLDRPKQNKKTNAKENFFLLVKDLPNEKRKYTNGDRNE